MKPENADRAARFCTPQMTLRAAARSMRENGCRVLPVLFEGRGIGSISDREICLALAEMDRPASGLLVWDAMFRFSEESSGYCPPEETADRGYAAPVPGEPRFT